MNNKTKRSAHGRNGVLAYPLALIAVVGALSGCSVPSAPDYDLVIAGGRVIDPQSGLDGIRNVAISDGRVVAISESGLAGEKVVDAQGLVVSPGFIDLHNHSPTPLGLRYQAFDGVTTTLELEAGAYPVASHGVALAGGAQLNIGASTGYAMIRITNV